VTDVSTVTLKVPPNLRRGHWAGNDKIACGTCVHFEGGRCRAYAGYPVSAGELCDSWGGETKVNESEHPSAPRSEEELIEAVMKEVS
jgi:hypothetical protein